MRKKLFPPDIDGNVPDSPSRWWNKYWKTTGTQRTGHHLVKNEVFARSGRSGGFSNVIFHREGLSGMFPSISDLLDGSTDLDEILRCIPFDPYYCMEYFSTSGSQVPTGSDKTFVTKVPQAIARVELYTLPKCHPNRFTRIEGDSFAHLKTIIFFSKIFIQSTNSSTSSNKKTKWKRKNYLKINGMSRDIIRSIISC